MTSLRFDKLLERHERLAHELVRDVRLTGQVQDRMSALISRLSALSPQDARERQKHTALLEKLTRLQFRYRH